MREMIKVLQILIVEKIGILVCFERMNVSNHLSTQKRKDNVDLLTLPPLFVEISILSMYIQYNIGHKVRIKSKK